MTIVLQGAEYQLKDFLFKNIVLTEDFPSIRYASLFLTKWISGGKEFEIKTSGTTTGEAKKLILKRKWLETSALQTIDILNLWEENVLCCLPTYKIGGLMIIVRSLAGGFNITVNEPKSDPMEDLPPDHSFTFVSFVPSQLVTIFKSAPSIDKLNRFKNILLGGSDIDTGLILKLQNLKPNVYHTYGMTETCSHIALKKLNNDGWTHFKPNPYVELKTNEMGWLSVKAFQTGNEWVHTKDCVDLYGDGSFDFLGRADFLINTGGFKVFPEQLEQKIKSIFTAQGWDTDIAITNRPDEKWGNIIVLVLNNEISEISGRIIEILRPYLDKFELPKQILTNPIPYNRSGKIDRLSLSQLVFPVS